MKKRLQFILLVGASLLLVIGLVLPACSSEGEKGIKLGVITDLTGPIAYFGLSQREGMEVRLNEANYQVAGKSIEVIWEDSTGDAATAAEKARKLIELDEVDVIIGPMFSDSQDAIAPYVAEHNVLDIAPIGGSWELSQYDNWIVFPGTLYSFGVPLGDYAYDQGWRTMTTLGADYIAGQRLIGGVADRFKERGGTVVQEQWSPVGELDFAPYLANLADADVFCIWTLPLGATITHYLELGLKIPLVIPEADQLESSSLGEFGDAFLGQVGMVSAYTSRLDNPLNHQFVAALGKDANIMHGSGHVATSILLAGLEATGGDASLEVLRPAILNLVNLDTVAGPISFSPTGNVLSNRYMAEVSFIDGRYVWEPFQVYRDVRDPRE